ncbi:MAG: DUF2845 domain-containing protein [Gammaproteobacteria bacterium]
MRIKITLLVAAFLLGLFTLESAIAGSMRCGVHTVSDGGRYPPGKYEILKKCGEPTYKEGNTWVYESQSKIRQVLRFDDANSLISIE